MDKNILNKIIIEWNNSEIEDSGLLKASDIKSSMIYPLVYTLNKPGRIKIFDSHWNDCDKFRDKVYINGKHVELNEKGSRRGSTINEYGTGEYYVYIDGFDELNEIGWGAFYGCTCLTSMAIPDSVTRIGNNAFQYCRNLTSVTIPDSVKVISNTAFSGCTGLTSVSIPNSVTKINPWVFSDCINLTSVTIGNSVTTIGNCAFNGCTGLTSVTIPNSVKEIDDWTFYYCIDLTEVTIPNSVKEIGSCAFKYCQNLKTVYVEDIDKFHKIKFEDETANPTCYGAKLIELKK